jgi:Ca2+-binding RTX toxin-like protein
LSGGDGDDTIRGLGGNDDISHGDGDDVVYGGDGDDGVSSDSGKDVIYGGAGNDGLDSHDDGGDKLYCGAGRDKYWADKEDYVDSSCETNSAAGPHQIGYTGHDVVNTSSASASSFSAPQVLASGGGPAILPLAAALLFGSGILTYAILRRR